MATPGGDSIMMGQWRVVLRQAEEAARGGRYEEAYALARRPEAADHQQVARFRARLALDLIARASRRAACDDVAGAIADLRLAERFEAPPDALAAARLDLADRAAGEIRDDLDAGEPGRALERIDALGRDKVSGPALRRCREVAEAWAVATAEGRRGEFGRALEGLASAERLAAGAGMDAAREAVAAALRDLETRRKAAGPLAEALYAALSEGDWARILAAAEAVLAGVPEHPAAREARARAWQRIAAVGPSSGSRWAPRRSGAAPTLDVAAAKPPREPEPDRPVARSSGDGPSGRFLLWADAVGGYLVCLDERVLIGRAGPDASADIPLMGDLSRRHAVVVRGGEGYTIEPIHDTFVNGRRVEGPAILRDGDVIRLGPTVELEFRQPSPYSATARLTVVSRHRLPMAVDGVLLMAETCIVGPAAQAHVPAPDLREAVVLYRQGGSLWCRARGGFEVDGRPGAARAALSPSSGVRGEGFSFKLEPLGASPA
ncbi:FHA domain-containing protein [Paludisphaera sp.]|uniref:FHA domain-containing protein n=1 Tax=Paludisphaera sp. TaxID=2017432 RepID=UPI00301CA3F8